MADILRQAIIKSGLSASAIVRATGVSQQTISAFLGGSGIRLENAGRVAKLVGLELRAKKRSKKP